MGEDKAAPLTAIKEEEVYWGRARSDSVGIVVVTAWMMSKPRHLKKHTSLYASCAWDSLVAHPKVLLLWFPTWARALAIRILDKLVQELKDRPRPVVFATFSGGLKSCLYQIFEILDESDEGADTTLAKYRIVKDCYAGQIHDSSPIDFVYSLGAVFATDPTTLGTKKRNAVLTWSAHAVAKGVDFLLHSRFERERAGMWSIAYKTGAWGPVLVLCSKDDHLAAFEVIQNYSSRLSSLGCKVTMLVWENSRHVGHLRWHPEEYKSAVASFISDAVASFALKMADRSQDGFQSPNKDGSIGGSVTSGSMRGGQKLVHKNQDPLSVRLESQTSGNGRVTVWIPSRM